MGNQVVVVVPFSKFKNVRRLDVVDILNSDMNNDDVTVIKNINFGSYPEKIFMSGESSKELICSNFHHASDDVSLYVDSENLTYFANYKHDINKSEDKIDSLVKNYRFDNKMNLSVTKNRREINQLKDNGEKYFIFGFLTDQFHELNNQKFANMLDYAEKMEPLSENESVDANNFTHSKYGYNANDYRVGAFTPIAVLKSNQFAIVKMSGNVFYLTAFPKNIRINPSTMEVKQFDKESMLKEQDGHTQAFKREVIESFGFTVKKK